MISGAMLFLLIFLILSLFSPQVFDSPLTVDPEYEIFVCSSAPTFSKANFHEVLLAFFTVDEYTG